MVPPSEGGVDLSDHTALPELNSPPLPPEYRALNKSNVHRNAYVDPKKIAEIKDTGIYACMKYAHMYECLHAYM